MSYPGVDYVTLGIALLGGAIVWGRMEQREKESSRQLEQLWKWKDEHVKEDQAIHEKAIATEARVNAHDETLREIKVMFQEIRSDIKTLSQKK